MHRKTELSIGMALAAAALVAGVAAGCSSSGSGGNSPTSGATTSVSPTVSSSVGVVTLPASTSAATPTVTANAAGANTPPMCSTNDLSGYVSIVPNSAGAGNELMNVKLTNTSGHTCTIYGYPGFLLEDQHQSGLPTNVVRSNTPVSTVTVPNGGSAATTVRFDFDVPGTGDATTGPCQPESYYMEITPPDQTTQLVAQISGGPVTVCQSGEMTVMPFVSGATGPNQ